MPSGRHRGPPQIHYNKDDLYAVPSPSLTENYTHTEYATSASGRRSVRASYVSLNSEERVSMPERTVVDPIQWNTEAPQEAVDWDGPLNVDYMDPNHVVVDLADLNDDNSQYPSVGFFFFILFFA